MHTPCLSPCAFAPLQNVAVGSALFPDYVTAVRVNAMAGGDNCSRGTFLGALFAAQVRAPRPPAYGG